jgi:hypothetical protein
MIIKYSIAVALLGAILSTGTLAFIVQTAQKAHAASFSVVHRILMDDDVGHARGWDPDGSTRSFAISDNEFNSSTSVVVINTQQGNFGICQVDWWSGQFNEQEVFEVNCIETTNGHAPTTGQMPVLEGGPSEGSVLKYAIISTEPSESMAPAPALAEEARGLVENRTSTAQNSTGG